MEAPTRWLIVQRSPGNTAVTGFLRLALLGLSVVQQRQRPIQPVKPVLGVRLVRQVPRLNYLARLYLASMESTEASLHAQQEVSAQSGMHRAPIPASIVLRVLLALQGLRHFLIALPWLGFTEATASLLLVVQAISVWLLERQAPLPVRNVLQAPQVAPVLPLALIASQTLATLGAVVLSLHADSTLTWTLQDRPSPLNASHVRQDQAAKLVQPRSTLATQSLATLAKEVISRNAHLEHTLMKRPVSGAVLHAPLDFSITSVGRHPVVSAGPVRTLTPLPEQLHALVAQPVRRPLRDPILVHPV